MKIGFVSLGCPKNLVDSDVMLGLVQQAGHTITAEPSEADVLVVNTCAFIDSAKQESIDTILEMAAHKRGRATRLVVTGCLGERYREELRREMPEIDVVLGTDEVPDIVRAVEGPVAPEQGRVPHNPAKAGSHVPHNPAKAGSHVPVKWFRRGEGSEACKVEVVAHNPAEAGSRVANNPAEAGSRVPTYIYDADTPRILTTPAHYAYVKIAEGCDYKCAFCIIPRLRGAYRSRPANSLVDEAGRLAERGVRELILISQDTTFYGVDRGERGALARLLRRLNTVDGLEWIRLLYLYPTTVDDAVLDAIGDCEKVCNYIDLPLQHASPAVLKRMKRPGSGASYARLLDRIRLRLPGVTLRTTFIVGFPGETESEFDELKRFAAEQAFDHLGVFTYSHEEGTSAHRLDDDVAAPVKAARQRSLMTTQRAAVARRNRERIGEQVRLLVDGPSREHEYVLTGRLGGQAPEIDSVVYLSECDPSAVAPGTFLRATITGARGYDLVAEPVDRCPQM